MTRHLNMVGHYKPDTTENDVDQKTINKTDNLTPQETKRWKKY